MTDEKLEKISEIRFGSPSVTKGKALEAMASVLRGESHKAGEPYKITYVELEEVRKASQPGLTFNWGCGKVGFGQVTLVNRDGKLYIDDEGMDKQFIKEMFNYLIDEYYKEIT